MCGGRSALRAFVYSSSQTHRLSTRYASRPFIHSASHHTSHLLYQGTGGLRLVHTCPRHRPVSQHTAVCGGALCLGSYSACCGPPYPSCAEGVQLCGLSYTHSVICIASHRGMHQGLSYAHLLETHRTSSTRVRGGLKPTYAFPGHRPCTTRPCVWWWSCRLGILSRREGSPVSPICAGRAPRAIIHLSLVIRIASQRGWGVSSPCAAALATGV
jgi:hypothetical protein